MPTTSTTSAAPVTLSGGTGADRLTGGAGNDLLIGNDGADQLFGGDGQDSLSGGTGNDQLSGGSGNDRMDGGSGDDRLEGGAGADTLWGGSGLDMVDYSASGAGVSVNLTSWTAAGGDAQGDVLGGVDGIIGSAHDDTLIGFDGQSTSGDVYTNVFYGGDGQDLMDGRGGNDTLYGGSGNDSVLGGEGQDILDGGGGDDTLSGGNGADSLAGDAGNDTLWGGEGQDTIAGGAGDNLVDGGGGSDRIVAGGGGADRITGGEDADGRDIDTLDFSGTGAVNLTLGGTEQGSFRTADGDNGNFTEIEAVQGSQAADVIDAGAGQSAFTIDGGAGADRITGGRGNDSLSGGDGDDIIRGGAGRDVIATGSGADQVGLAAAGGDDVITDFDLTQTDKGGPFRDQIDASDLRTGSGQQVRSWDVTVTDDGTGNAKLVFPGGETLVLQGVKPDQMREPGALQRAGIPCFTAGTLIDTTGGPVAVEHVRPGDRVLTRDNGPQQVRWVAVRVIGADELARHPALRPVRIGAGALGNRRDLLVSPLHGLLIRQTDRGGGESLVRAGHLSRLSGGAVDVAWGVRGVTYVHILFDSHQIVRTEGLLSESFFPGPQALGSLDGDVLRELVQLFPDLIRAARLGARQGGTARPFMPPRTLPPDLRALGIGRARH